ncbi:TetR/AcrR family transcriptional regulator [Gloeomargarita lithophora]|nr:TetR/AcrR family transcriptional regulator [Gloeomargarita lithophora]
MTTKGEQTQRRIIEVAAELFWKNSYQGVNTHTISEVAGVNKATLYRYFASKDDLALAVIAYYGDLVVTTVFAESFRVADDPLDCLAEIYRRVYQTALEQIGKHGISPGCPFVNLVVEMATVNPAIRQAIDHCFARFAVYYRRLVQTAKHRGISPAHLDEDQTVKALINIMNGAMVASKVKNQPEEILKMAAVAQQMLKG